MKLLKLSKKELLEAVKLAKREIEEWTKFKEDCEAALCPDKIELTDEQAQEMCRESLGEQADIRLS